MKRKLFLTLFGTALLGMILSACGGSSDPKDKVPAEHKPSKDTPNLNVDTKVATFASQDGYQRFFASSGYGNGDPFNVVWNGANAVIENSELHLKITEAQGAESPYYGGELRSTEFYGYGDYGVRMKPAKATGTASTFFTYTGEWDSETKHPSTGESDTKNPDNPDGIHDEIDIEFLGKDTTKVQFNYFTNGVGGNEYMYDLGFDASLEYHTYGFRWEEGRITWFVDLEPVYTATTNIPTHPGRIVSNYWCGTERAAGWMDEYTPSSEYATYQWFSSNAVAKETHKEIVPPDPSEQIDWSKYEAVPFTNVSGNTETYNYGLANEDKEMNITYTDVTQNYNNLNIKVPNGASEARALSFEVTNNGTEPVNLRADADAATAHGEHNITAVNVSATQDGVPVATNLEWGGSSFMIAPGETSLCEILYSDVIVRIGFMIDSHVDGTHSGDITIKNLKFDIEGSFQPEDPAETPEIEKPADVESEFAMKITDLAGNKEIYDTLLSDDAKALAIGYADAGDNSYYNLNFKVASAASEARKVSFKVENKGTEAVAVRADAEAATTHGEHNIKAVNTSATQDDEEVYTNLEWGGSNFSIAGGKTALCVVEYNDVVTRLSFMIDSHVPGNQSGYIVLSEVTFYVDSEAIVVPEDEPVTPPSGDDELPALVKPDDVENEKAFAITDLAGNEDDYVNLLSDDAKALAVRYEGVAGNSYFNLNFAVPASTNRQVSFKITNVGENSVSIRIDAEAITTHGAQNIKAVNTSATQDGQVVPTDLEWGGSVFTVAGETTSLCAINYNDDVVRLSIMIDSHKYNDSNLYSGYVVLSEFALNEVEEQEGNVYTLSFLSQDGYVCSADKGVSTITYESVSENTYKNTSADIVNAPDSTNMMKFKITNNAEHSVQFNFELFAGELSIAETRDGISYDYFSGNRVQVNVGANGSRDVTIAYKAGNTPTRITAFINSYWALEGSEATYTNGNITISNVEFSSSN